MEQSSFWFQGRARLLVWALRKYFPSATSVLEVGCGTGYALTEFSKARRGLRCAGAELHAEGLQFARERLPDAEFYQLDAIRMPFVEEFDVVGCFDVLEHIEDDIDAMKGIRQAVAPGGGALITVPQHRWLWSAADDYGHHVRRYTRRELVEKLGRAGFEIQRVTSFVSLLLPMMLVSRLLQRDTQSFDPEVEHRQARRMLPVLGRVMTAERQLIRAGLNLPAGGSLLAVCRAKPRITGHIRL